LDGKQHDLRPHRQDLVLKAILAAAVAIGAAIGGNRALDKEGPLLTEVGRLQNQISQLRMDMTVQQGWLTSLTQRLQDVEAKLKALEDVKAKRPGRR